ncbi:MAG: GNAT family N-acetyltransferase [Oscillochloris sp.]|nr:GNAT family N-acetyltransferase [Oscillochloris sp.]
MELRTFHDTEFSALLDLCRAGLREEVAPNALRRLFFDEPERKPAYHLALWEGSALVGALLGGIRHRPEGMLGGVRLLVVAPQMRRRGLATQLLTEIERLMHADRLPEIRFGHIGPNYLWPGVDLRDTPAICLLQKRGYQRFGEALNMDVDLTISDWSPAVDEVRLAAAGWTVRRAEPADQPALSAWVAAEFSAAWVWEASQALQAQPISAFLALHDGRIRGFACYDVSGLRSCFGPTGVDPSARGLGLGRVLLLRCLADMRARGDSHAEIGWVGPLAFYSTIAAARIGRVCWFMRR